MEPFGLNQLVSELSAYGSWPLNSLYLILINQQYRLKVPKNTSLKLCKLYKLMVEIQNILRVVLKLYNQNPTISLP